MYMSIENTLNKRKQIKLFDTENIPDKKLIISLIDKTFELVPSKQSLMPYKVHVLGPEFKDLKERFFNISKTKTGGVYNNNILAPYVLIFTRRLVKNPNIDVQRKIAFGHNYGVCDPKRYKNFDKDVAIEIGMFSKILTALCLENNIDVSYLLCFPTKEQDKRWYEFDFLDDEILFSMQLGYKSNKFTRNKNKEEIKPEKNEIINWLKG